MFSKQERAERRLVLVQNILEQFNLKSKAVTPLAYIENYPYEFNNFLFKVELESPALPQSFPGSQPGTVAAPVGGVASLVVRISNLHADDINHTNRVQNDVACEFLARQAMQRAGLSPVVPDMYAWSPPKTLDKENMDDMNFGWFVTEHKAGADLDAQYPSLSPVDKEDALSQMAGILAALQQAEIPPAARQFGGVSFNEKGDMVPGQASLMQGGPFESYADLWKYKLQSQLGKAGKSPVLDGWKEDGLDNRIQAFIDSDDIGKILATADSSKCSLVHCDLTMNNILYDGTTKKITGLLDFDFSGVSHPAEEYTCFCSLTDVGGGLGDEPKGLLDCVLANDFSKPPQENMSEKDTKQWETAKMWNRVATEKGVVTLGAIPGIQDIRKLRKLHQTICPHQLSHEAPPDSSSDEAKAKKKAETRDSLIAFLEERGF